MTKQPLGRWFYRTVTEGQPYLKEDGTTPGFDSIWQRYMKAWVEKGGERFTFHDLRAKRASDLSADQAQIL